jgi:hypothetical protein
LTLAVEKAIRVIEGYDMTNGVIEELKQVVINDGVDFSD